MRLVDHTGFLIFLIGILGVVGDIHDIGFNISLNDVSQQT
jgi:hypothetical protein